MTIFNSRPRISAEIQSLQNHTILVDIDAESFSLNIPFVCDEWSVQAFIVAPDAADNTPLPAHITDGAADNPVLMNNNMISIESNMGQSPLLCICNMGNTANPVYRQWNNGRNQYSGTYTFNARNMVDRASMADGQVILKFEFIRYVTDTTSI